VCRRTPLIIAVGQIGFGVKLRWRIQQRSGKYSTVQYSTIQYSTVQYSTIQYSTVQYSTVQYSTVQYSTVQYSTVQYNKIQYSTVQYSTVQENLVILLLYPQSHPLQHTITVAVHILRRRMCAREMVNT
jgi:hypothetical protein